jgi:hypothetical protein
MSDGINILAAANKAYDLVHSTRRGIIFKIAELGGVWFLLKPARFWRDKRGIFLFRAGFKRDTGGVSQLLQT